MSVILNLDIQDEYDQQTQVFYQFNIQQYHSLTEDQKQVVKSLDLTQAGISSIILASIVDLPLLQDLKMKKCYLRDMGKQNCRISLLKTLNVEEAHIDANFIDFIIEFTQLRSLEMQNSSLIPFSVPIFEQDAKIHVQFVNICYSELKGTDFLFHLFLMPCLEDLNISNCKIKNFGQNIDYDFTKSQIKVINASNNDIDDDTAIFLCNLPKLKEIIIANCNLKCLPAFPQNSEVQKINISNNKVTNSITQLFMLPFLNDLNISGCNIEDIGEFDPLKCKITKIEIDKNRFNLSSLNLLMKLPAFLNASELNLNSMNLRFIPNFLTDSKFQSLNMECNRFENTSHLINLLERQCLKYLCINRCNIQQIEAINYKISQIISLNVACNKLNASFVNQIVCFPLLENLSLQRCELSDIPSFSYNTKLQTLDISFNQFNDTLNLSKIVVLPHLIQLNIEYCNIKSIGEFDPFMSQITILKFSKNQFDQNSMNLIVQLPAFRTQEKLLLQNNDICYIPILPTTSKLKQLFFNSNRLRNTENLTKLIMMPYLTEVDMSYCNIVYDSQIYCTSSNIVSLNLEQNSLSPSFVSQVLQLTSLQQLNVRYCDIVGIDQFSTKQSVLNELNIGQNKLDDNAVRLISTLPLLEKISMQRCNLKAVPHFPADSRIKQVDFRYNNLAKADMSRIFQLQNLENLDIFGCKIEQLPSFDSVKSKLKDVNISFAEGILLDEDSILNILSVQSLEKLVTGCESLDEMYFRNGSECKLEMKTRREVFRHISNSFPFLKWFKDERQAAPHRLKDFERSFRENRLVLKSKHIVIPKSAFLVHSWLIKEAEINNRYQILLKCIQVVRSALEQ